LRGVSSNVGNWKFCLFALNYIYRIQTEYYISGIAPFGEYLVALAALEDVEEEVKSLDGSGPKTKMVQFNTLTENVIIYKKLRLLNDRNCELLQEQIPKFPLMLFLFMDSKITKQTIIGWDTVPQNLCFMWFLLTILLSQDLVIWTIM
jgi:hypothetical protein